MKREMKPWLTSCAVLFFFLQTGAAYAARCSTACTSTTSCATECVVGRVPDLEVITCGEYGVCADPPPPPCVSNWVTTVAATGGYAVNYFANTPSHYRCEYYHFSRIVKHDTNNCQPDQVFCVLDYVLFRDDSLCCQYYFCGGETCGYQ